MKRLLTILLFIVCVLITILIVKIDDYAYVIYPSHNNLPSDNVNNKLENNNNNDNENNNNNTNNAQKTHKVVKGDSLWDIAQKYYGNG